MVDIGIFAKPTLIGAFKPIGNWRGTDHYMDIYSDISKAISFLKDEPSYLLISYGTRQCLKRLDYNYRQFEKYIPELFGYKIIEGCDMSKEYFINTINDKIIKISSDVPDNVAYIVSYNNKVVAISDI